MQVKYLAQGYGSVQPAYQTCDL
uniref:Uncharacterized protein n=1 Tax=Anguilla anguilla TaxID=7936 RepID=A0A0E9T7T8_ANGAN